MKFVVMWIHDDAYGGMQFVEANNPREATNAYKTVINKDYVIFQVCNCESGQITTFPPRVDEYAKGYKRKGWI